ncbi:Putative Clr5 domain-containing protein [Colletotrichum destructivum]|uniref:Clr5 domain-containing protein n=1 Tax=Colletotrichum destructivum TaxID=34406 RepID=A0AAX4J1S7_9PEZI|nr:Putative Clr5 domain-containing protein [Colletotrichum destructivum]
MPVPPTAEEWESYRPLIADLYTRRTLKDIRAQLKNVHGFHATERMYKGRLKSWGIEKNKRHNRRPPPPPPPTPPKESARSPGAVACQTRPTIITTPSDDCQHRKEPHAPKPSSQSPFALTPVASPYPRDDGLETRSTTCIGTPQSFPPTPATTLGYRSPNGYDHGDLGGDPEVLCKEIVNCAISILSNLVPGRPPGTGFEDCTPTDDHLAIYRTLQDKLRYETQIRGNFVNIPSSASTTDLRRDVKMLLDNFHEAMPIGILSTINQSLDHHAIQQLASCLATSSQEMPRPNSDFIRLAQSLRHLLAVTTFENFQGLMDRICEELEGKVLKVLGQRSLVTVYLVFILNSKKAKSKQQLDNRILSMAMGRMSHVKARYGHEALLVVKFSQFIIGYRNLAKPEGQFDQDVLDMAEDCYNLSEQHLREQEEAKGASYAAITDAKSHYGKSCSLLADCRYSQGNEYAGDRAELHDWSRRLLLMAIGCHVDSPMGTLPYYERQKQKLERWCREAGDTTRLRQLEDIEELIRGNEERPKDGPLLPRLQALGLGSQIGTEKGQLVDGKPDR